MKKRILALALVLVMSFALVPFALANPNSVPVFCPDPNCIDGTLVPQLITRVGLRTTWIPQAPERLAPIPHTVVPGQTLAHIAAMHRTTVAAIKAANVAYFNTLFGTGVEIEANATINIPRGFANMVYRVQLGDTLQSIALNYYGKSTAAITAAITNANIYRNPDGTLKHFAVTGGVLEADRDLVLPGVAAGVSLRDPITRGSYVPYDIAGIYVVRSGDTLSSISQRFYGSTVLAGVLRAVNRATVPANGAISVGQWLLIPAYTSCSDPSHLPVPPRYPGA